MTLKDEFLIFFYASRSIFTFKFLVILSILTIGYFQK